MQNRELSPFGKLIGGNGSSEIEDWNIVRSIISKRIRVEFGVVVIIIFFIVLVTFCLGLGLVGWWWWRW